MSRRLKKKGTVPFFYAVFSGVLTALCLPRPGLCFLGWIALVPLCFVCRPDSSIRESFKLGWTAGFFFHALSLFWIYQTCRFAGINVFLALLSWVLLAAFLGINWGFVSAAVSWLALKPLDVLTPWIWAVLWSASEALWLRTPRLCMDILSYTQYRFLPLIQIDSILGPLGLGFFILFFNASVAYFLYCEKPKKRLALGWIFLALLSIAGIFGYGAFSLSQTPKQTPSFEVAILQPNVDQYQKWTPNSASEITANLEELLSGPWKKNPSLILWPEAALPRLLGKEKTISEASFASVRWKSYQILGAVVQNSTHLYNAAYYLNPTGQTQGFYAKRELVPFGEYVPWDFLRRFIGYLDQLGDMTQGPSSPHLLRTDFGKIGCTICYEAVFPFLSRSEAKKGARAIANITNDGWYKETWGPYQHFYINRFRAVENRLYVLRAANTGISAVIDPWGRIIRRLPLNLRGRLEVSIPALDPFPRRSFYVRHGDWFGFLCVILSALIFFFRLTQKGTVPFF